MKLPKERGERFYSWVVAVALFVAWLVVKFVFGKEGFTNILLLAAIAVALVQWMQQRRAAQG